MDKSRILSIAYVKYGNEPKRIVVGTTAKDSSHNTQYTGMMLSTAPENAGI